MSHDHSQNHYGPNASFDGYDSDLASAGILIESLRQQLSGALASVADKTSHIDWLNDHCSNGWDTADELSEQLADSKKQVVMLREALAEQGTDNDDAWILKETALAATDDLKDVILCHAEPVGWCGTSGVGELIVSKSKVWNFLTTPLYRAWEPK